jgi:hypothetical protein
MKRSHEQDPALKRTSWVNEVCTKWLTEELAVDRKMQLLEEFGFRADNSPDGTWLVEEGETVDGASIPPLLWSVVGPPFVGNYRRATVIHDVYCEYEGKVPWEEPRMRSSYDVHKMFFLAMLADHTDYADACVMYAAVALFGPRWPSEKYVPARIRPMLMSDLRDIEGVVDEVLASGIPRDYESLQRELALRFDLPR